MNRHERRAARVSLGKAVQILGAAIQHRDRARDALAEYDAWMQGARLAGRVTVAMEARFAAVGSALIAAESDLEAFRADVAALEEAVEAASLDIVIHNHLTEIGLDALPY